LKYRICFCLILILFFMLISGCQPSENKVEEYRQKHTPGLKRAEDLGLVVEPKITQEIKEGMALTIEKVWYNSKEVYIFYSLSSFPEKLKEINFKLGHPDVLISSPGYNGGYPKENMVIDGKYYGRLTFSSLRDRNTNALLEQVEDVIISGIVLNYENNLELIQDIQIRVPINFAKAKEVEETYNLNQEIDVLGRKLVLESLTLGVGENEITGFLKGKEEEQFYTLKAKIGTNDNEERHFTGIYRTEEENGFRLTFLPFDQLPTELHLKLEQLSLIGTDQVSFTLDTAPYQEYLNKESGKRFKVNKLLGEKRNNKTFLEEVFVDDRGLNIEILHQLQDNMEEPYEGFWAISALNDDYSGGDGVTKYGKIANMMTVTNEKGEKGNLGQRSQGPGNRMGAFIEADFIKKSSTIGVTIDNLTSSIFLNKEISIKLDE